MQLRSHQVTQGAERAPQRSLLRACGFTEEEMNRPLIGVVSAYNEIGPGHINLDKIAQAVKQGVSMAGGTPILVPAIGVCDGHRHGSHRYEVFAGLPGADRRQRRDHGQRPRVLMRWC